jgi:uncharacterized protein YifN (PemK superfamily)
MEVRTEIVFERVWDSQYIIVIKDKISGKQVLTIPLTGKEPPEEIKNKIISSIKLPPKVVINLENEIQKIMEEKENG